jgi:hypothetical protein
MVGTHHRVVDAAFPVATLTSSGLGYPRESERFGGLLCGQVRSRSTYLRRDPFRESYDVDLMLSGRRVNFPESGQAPGIELSG